ncbi:hypothetical protein GOBAR_AA21464 [Gossypium barbadense]|uniref:Transposase MuDR plant domain-containing protein n=1 Tax=Gossypium barbadense TaxID=3634 RepID=A0A2P5X790_GOSBA|nr:hypothetical protein GOBAR_AA21464 [Gossypium barbadense]
MELKTHEQKFPGRLCTVLTSISTLDDQYGGGLQIHLVIIETDALGEDGSNNNDCSYHEGEDFSDPGLNDVLDDIDEEGQNDESDHAPLVENSSCGIVIRNDIRVHMSIDNSDTTHASEFPKYLDIISIDLMLEDPKSKELFVGQRIASKDECVNVIKRYSLKVSVDYKVPGFTHDLCWRYKNMLASYMHFCSLTHNQRKLDSKTICNCILTMVKDDPTIFISVFIAKCKNDFSTKFHPGMHCWLNRWPWISFMKIGMHRTMNFNGGLPQCESTF